MSIITLRNRNDSTNIKKVLLTLKELEPPYEQAFAGREFGISHDADSLATNPDRLVPLLCDNESNLILWESNAIVRYLTTQYGQKHLQIDSPAHRAEAEKQMDWANRALSNAHRGILMGLARTPPEERDQAAAGASCKGCSALFALLDAELAKVKWFSGNEFGVGDVAIAPFVYDLSNVGLTQTPRPNLQRWYQQLTGRPAMCRVVMTLAS